MEIRKLKKGIGISKEFIFDGNEEKGEKVFISHAHDDHLPTRKTNALTTSLTEEVANTRKGRRVICKDESRWNDIKYRLLDAGHVPGSKMLFMKYNDINILYTGDFSLHCNPLVKFEYPSKKVDILIMDATYFTPYYTLPPPEEVIEEIISFIDHTSSPMYFFVYPYGKGQTLSSYLDLYGIDYSFHESFYNLNTIVERHLGYNFTGDYLSLEEIKNKDHGVFIMPFHLRKYIHGGIKLGVSGWGKNPHYARRFGLDKVFPYSDHADFNDLIHFIEHLNPDVVYGFQLNGNRVFFEKFLREEYGIYAQGL